MPRKKKPDDGLCAFAYTIDIRIEQADAHFISHGIITGKLAAQLREALEEDLLIRSELFQAYWRDPPARDAIEYVSNQSQGIDIVRFAAGGRGWQITSKEHQQLIRLAAKLVVDGYVGFGNG